MTSSCGDKTVEKEMDAEGMSRPIPAAPLSARVPRGGPFASLRLYSVSPWNELTGAPISSVNHARLLRPYFGSVCLVLPAAGKLQDRAIQAELPVLLLPVENRGFRARFFRRSLGRDLAAVLGSRWRYFRTLCREFRRQPGIVHVHSSASIAPLALGAARLCGMPSVLHVREAAESWRDRAWMRGLAGLATAVVCVSDGIRQGYGTRIRRQAHVIHNFMELPPPSPPKTPAIPLVATAAVMCRRKGADVFLEVCRRLHEAGASFEAWIVGGWARESERQAAHGFLERHRLQALVKDVGALPDMEPVYDRMDVLLLTSRRDPFPRVVMEAMCHGIPVVATRVDGIPEMVADGASGILAGSEDVAGFAQAVKKLLDDRELRLRMGAAGRERARTLFSPETYAARMLELYREIGGSR